ncbi:MAG: MarR family transcriptional regulator [Ilumatobacteraceae bacterium]
MTHDLTSRAVTPAVTSDGASTPVDVDAPSLTIARLARMLESVTAAELTLAQYRVLGILSTNPHRATHLASRLTVSKPTLTALIDGLAERGFVEREGADGDRRVVRLCITAAGRHALASTAAHLRRQLDDVFGRCAEPALVLAALDDLRAALDARWVEKFTTRMDVER